MKEQKKKHHSQKRVSPSQPQASWKAPVFSIFCSEVMSVKIIILVTGYTLLSSNDSHACWASQCGQPFLELIGTKTSDPNEKRWEGRDVFNHLIN